MNNPIENEVHRMIERQAKIITENAEVQATPVNTTRIQDSSNQIVSLQNMLRVEGPRIAKLNRLIAQIESGRAKVVYIEYPEIRISVAGVKPISITVNKDGYLQLTNPDSLITESDILTRVFWDIMAGMHRFTGGGPWFENVGPGSTPGPTIEMETFSERGTPLTPTSDTILAYLIIKCQGLHYNLHCDMMTAY